MKARIWERLLNWKKSNPGKSQRSASKALGIPRSTLQYQEKKQASLSGGSEIPIFWQTAEGQAFIKRLLVNTIYTFGIKGGIGASRIEEFMDRLNLELYVGVSESSIYRMIKEIEASILWYQSLEEKGLKAASEEQAKELKVVLGLDETWLDEMLLVCQELTSGYLFLKSQAKSETRTVGGPSSKKKF